MATGFRATRLALTEEHGVLVTALDAPPTEEEDRYLMLQRKERSTEQDARSGMDQPYIEYCGQGWSWYGHIERFELRRDGVAVQMDPAAAARMMNDGSIEIGFDLGDDDFVRLRAALRRTFAGCRYFVEDAPV